MVLSSRFFSFITLKHNRSGSSTRLFSLFIFTTFISGYQQLFGQSTFAATDPFQAYYDARQWFSEGNYGLSYPVFKDLERKISSRELPDRSVQYDEVLFYTLACELMQDNIGAERHAQAYLAGNVSSAYKGQMGYYLGTHYFRKQQYAEAIEAFGHSTAENLSPAQRSEMQFVLGYSLLTQRKFKEAKAQLNEVRDKPDSRHYVDANYYYGLLAYNDGQYREALRCFEIAGTSSVYQPLAPYYTASIQYALGNKAKGLELAEAALKSGNQFYELELNQLIGHAYFEKGDYRTATPFLEKYVNGSAKVNRADLYELAYCYYQLGNWDRSIEMFKPLSDGKDSLSQHAMYLLGDAYLKTNDKANAKTAFRFCAANSSYPAIRENSMFNDGKLSYELGLDDEAIQVFRQYINAFPQGKNGAEARELLIASLANTSNYREALSLYESLPNKTAAIQRYYPRLLYNRAQEEINDRRLDEADRLLDKGLAAPYNESVLPLLQFWKGEIAFFRKDYAQASRYMSAYLQQPVTNGEANPENARYTLAYSYLLSEQYSAAEREFETLSRARIANAQQQEDVSVRLADAQYMQKIFAKAKPIYSSMAERSRDYADHSLYQLGMIAGAENRPAQKISYLQSIESRFPNSLLAPVANLEIAKTFLSDEKYREALPWLNKVIAARGAESLKPEALLKQGLAYYNLNNSTEALNSFRLLINRYGDSPEADEAIDNVRSIYVELGRPNDLVGFMNSVGRNLDKSTADSLSFVSAEIQLSEGKKDQALAGFKDYLVRYPDGRYHIQAIWSSAEIYREKKDLNNAIPLYETLISKAPNRHVEASLLQVSRYYYFEEKNYKKASGFYQLLIESASSQENKVEAMRGLVRCMYYGGEYADATRVATELLEQRGIGTDDKIFANLVLGKQAAQKNNCTEAIRYYKQVADLSKAEYGAEARYGIAMCQFNLAKYEDAEAAAFDVIRKSGSYAIWVTRSYILLGDIYHKQKDYFNAKATYKSVSENASIPELKEEATRKLALVEKEEKEGSKISQ